MRFILILEAIIVIRRFEVKRWKPEVVFLIATNLY